MSRKFRNSYTMVFLCLISVLPLYSSIFSPLSPAAQSENLGFLKYEVNDVFVGSLKHTIQINNPTSHRVMGGNLFVPLVKNETARHYVILYNISSQTEQQPTILNDDSGNTYAYLSDLTIDKNQAFTVEIKYYVLSFSIRYLINSSLTTNYDENSDLYKKYTQPEELIQSDNLTIISKAENLTSSANDIHEKVSNIYNFVITHMRYVVQDDERGALWALENKTGDCSEYSYLFVALCRAAGIPAKVQAGFAFRSLKETLKDGHMWAEYYLENYGWIPVDATWRLFDVMDFRHFSSIQSIPEIIPYANYVFNYTTRIEGIGKKQVISMEPCSPNVFGDSFAETTMKTVQKIKQAQFALFLGRVFGAPLIFSSETEKTRQTLLEGQIHLQKAISSFEAQPQLAQSNVVDALESAEEASRCAWTLVVKTFALFVSIPAVIMLVALVFLKRYQTKQKKKPSENIAEVSFTRYA